MLMETEEEISRRPTAIRIGFRSGFASETILRKDDAVCGDLLKSDNIDDSDFSGAGWSGFGATEVFLRGG